jgi:TPR repeat protein
VPSGQRSMGTMYFNGAGVPQDYAMALRLFRLAAEQEDSGAQTKLGTMYYLGKGVPQDYVEGT